MTTHNCYELAEQMRENDKDAFTKILNGEIVALGTTQYSDKRLIRMQFILPSARMVRTSLVDGKVTTTLERESLLDWYRYMGDNTEDDRMVFMQSKLWVPRLINLYKLIFDEVSSFKFNHAVKEWHDELIF